MKKFIQHTLAFLLPIIIGLGILFFLPTNKKRAYHYLTDDCEGRGAWMYRRIFESKEPIDIAFLGSSHTINGINDTLISRLIAKDNSVPCNLGYCRLGRDLTYVLMKHCLEQKKTKGFIIEVLPDEPAMSHPVFAFLAEGLDVIQPKTIFNRSYAGNFHAHMIAKLNYLRQDLWNVADEYKYALRETSGFTTNTFYADTNTLKTKKEARYKNQYRSHQWTRKFNMPFPKAWLSSISSLAKANNCPLIFLYIPPYGSPEKVPIEMATYQKYGLVWLPPDSIFTNRKNWYDEEHLNLRGANSLSTWVAGKLR